MSDPRHPGHRRDGAGWPRAGVSHLIPGNPGAGAAFATAHGTGTVCDPGPALSEGVIVAPLSDLHGAQANAVLDAGRAMSIVLPVATIPAD